MLPGKNVYKYCITALILSQGVSGIISLHTGVIPAVVAASSPKLLAANDVKLPTTVANAVLRKTAELSGLPISKLRIIQAQKRTWSDSCLGLPEPGVLCTQVVVAGWRVSVASGKQRWNYRTNNTGAVVKWDLRVGAATLPSAVATVVLQDASKFTGIPRSELKIVQVEKRLWSDGCLGLVEEPDVVCTQATPGWKVIVEGRQARLEYRTNETGSLIKLESAISYTSVPNPPVMTPSP